MINTLLNVPMFKEDQLTEIRIIRQIGTNNNGYNPNMIIKMIYKRKIRIKNRPNDKK